MRRSRTSATLALVAGGLVAAAAGTLAPAPAGATPAPVAVICPPVILTNPATDFVKMTGVGIDAGTLGLDASNDPTCSGTLRWDTTGGTTTPSYTTDLIMKNSLGVTARILMVHRDVHGNWLGSRASVQQTAATNAETSFPVTLNSFSSPFAYEVEVATQILSAGAWVDVDRESFFLSSSNQPADQVTISSVGQWFGTGGLAGAVPAAPGTLTWDLTGGTTRARLTGALIMRNSLGVSARMRLVAYDVDGTQLSSTPGGTVTPASNAEQSWAVNLSTPVNPLLYKTVTSIEVQVGGAWTTVGTPVTSYI